ncbi:MAG: biotin carboxylase, partial [Flavobacteriales bacterium]
FMPDIGTLTAYEPPKGIGTRVDDGYEVNMEIPIHYDSMIAKLIIHGDSREEAIQRMKRAIDEYRIAGVSTTLPFCDYVMNHKAFLSGDFDTHFVKEHFDSEQMTSNKEDEELVASVIAAELHAGKNGNDTLPVFTPEKSGAWNKNRRDWN